MLDRRAVRPHEERYSLNETFEKLRGRKNHLGVEGSQRGGNSPTLPVQEVRGRKITLYAED